MKRVRTSFGLPQAIAAVVVVVAVVAGLFILAAALMDEDEEQPDITGRPPVIDPDEAPEFIDVFPPEAPGGGEVDTRATCERNERISWSEADSRLNTRVAVLGPVTEVTENAEGQTELTLGLTEDAKRVTVVLTDQITTRLPGEPEDLYEDEAVCVIGVLRTIDERIEVIVNEPSEISVF